MINPGTAAERRIGPIETTRLAKGDILQIARSGGGGCGAPWLREPEAVLADVRDGYVSIDGARDRYGVVIEAAPLSIDEAATRAARTAIAASQERP